MRITLSDPRARFTFVSLVTLIFAAFSYSAAKSCLAAAWSSSPSPERWETAARLEPGNAAYLEKLGLDDWWRHRHPIFRQGVYEKDAVSHRPKTWRNASVYLRPLLIGGLILVALLALGAIRLLFSPRDDLAGSQPESRITIAVLPFETLSPDPNDRSLAAVITQEVVKTLGKSTRFNVIPMSAAEQSRPAAPSPEQADRKRHPVAFIEGVIKRSGDRIQVATQLIDASTGRQISADQFDRSSLEKHSLETEVPKLISESVRASLQPSVAAP